MPKPAIILYDDGHTLSPLTDLRASFELRTGAAITMQRLSRQLQAPFDALFVPPPLAPVVSQRWTAPVNKLPDGDSFLLINGRCTSLPGGAMELPVGSAMVDANGKSLVAHLDRSSAQAMLATRSLGASVRKQPVDLPLLVEPWQLLDHVKVNLPGDLATCNWPAFSSVSPIVRVTGDYTVRAASSADIHPMVVFDCTAGHIIIDEHAVVEPFVVLQGPCHIGPHTTIVAHAHIRPFTVIGEHCKIGGEVSASVFHGCSNKSHFGYVGNSIIGQWVNLGAGTTTSNLKNTYGPIAMQINADTPPQSTGRTFLGSILGDHVKTAIGTRLTTGSCIGTGSMIACSTFPPKFVDRFAFITDSGVQRYDLRKFLEVAARVMQRRDATMSEADQQRLTQLYSSVRV